MTTPPPSTTPSSSAAEPAELPIGQILSIFWRGRWIILGTTVLATAVGYWYVERRGTIWRAQSRVYVEKGGNNMTGGADLLLGLGSKNYANTQAELMLSTPVLGAAFREFGDAFPGDKNLIPDTSNEIAWLKKNVNVSVGKDDDVITVSIDSNHKEQACTMVNEIVDAYADFQADKQKNSAKDLREGMENDANKKDEAYQAALDAYFDFKNEHPTSEISGPEQQLVRLTVDLDEAKAVTQEAKSAFDTAKQLFEADPQALRPLMPALLARGTAGPAYPPEIALLSTEIQQLKRQMRDMLLQLQPETPSVALRAQEIADLESELEQQRASYSNSCLHWLQRSHEAAAAVEADLASRVAALDAEVEAQALRSQQAERLKAELERAQTLRETALTRLADMTITDEDANRTYVYPIDIAHPASTEVASGKPLRLAASVLLGLFLGAGLAWLRGLMDQRLRNAEEVRKALDLSILAIMPRVKMEKNPRPALEAWSNRSPSAEAARSLRTAVYFGMNKKEDGNVLQVTSPDPGDGKSTTATQLAIAMAKAGQKVLLIDADLRKPQQHNRLSLSNEQGLTHVLARSTPTKDVIQESAEETLHVMTSGPVPANPAEILNSDRFDKILKEVSRRYDWVIVDSPPVLPVADARIIASKCDMTILTIRVDKSTKKRANAAQDAILDVGASILGVALNDMPHGIGYGYGPGYGYYGRSYGYGHDVPPSTLHDDAEPSAGSASESDTNEAEAELTGVVPTRPRRRRSAAASATLAKVRSRRRSDAS